MEIKEAQEKIKKFDYERGWDNSWDIKDLSLNITEEVGELWNMIKWVDDKTQKKIVEENKEEVSDFVGDALFIILKIANQTSVNAEESLMNSIKDFEKRMPPEEIKRVKHGNRLAGGIDNKDY